MSGPSDRSSHRRYIRAPRVVTATPRGVIEDGAVAVEGSRIVAVGPAGEVTRGAAPGAVETYADATLMPGLVDAHAHLTLAADRRTYEQMVLDPDEMMALVSVVEPPAASRLRRDHAARQRRPQPRDVHRARGHQARLLHRAAPAR